MDPVTVLAAAVVAFLAQGAAADQPSESVVAVLEQRFQSKPAAQEALADFTSTPEDQDAQAALRHQLKKALVADPGFQAELARLLQEAGGEAPAAIAQASPRGAVAQGPGMVAAGPGGRAIAGDVRGRIIVTGVGNVVDPPEKDRQQ